MRLAIFMKASGQMGRQTAKGLTMSTMGSFTKETERMINKMEKAQNHGPMAQNTKAITWTVLKMGKEN